MKDLIFDILRDEQGHYTAQARGIAITARGASFELMRLDAFSHARAYVINTVEKPPSTFSVSFHEILRVA